MKTRTLCILAGLLWIGAAAHAAEGERMFTLTEAHLKLLRQGIVLWNPGESGAPAVLISPLEPSGTAEEIQADVARRAGLADPQRAKMLMEELPEAFAQMIEHGKLAPGRYEYANPLVDFAFVARTLPPETNSLATDKRVVFELTGQHIALLRAARWQGLWMNVKRPYGDMTYFELDMAEILHEPVKRDEEGQLLAAQEERLGKLHAETLPALQVYLQKAVIAPDEYPYIEVEPGPGMGRGPG